MIYTRKGDRGTTSMFEPDPTKRCRVSKVDPRVQAIGAVDEVNSFIGIANAFCKTKKTVTFMKSVQRDLFQIGSILSKAPLTLELERVAALETKIDELEEKLPPLRNFLMPEGTLAAVHYMYARALARRAERRVIALHNKEAVPLSVLEYMNRLSDLLFMVFRDENAKAKVSETLWVGRKNQ